MKSDLFPTNNPQAPARRPAASPKSRRGLPGSFCLAALLFYGATVAQSATLTDITTAPSPGPFDISQLSNAGNVGGPGGLNYYDNNSQPPGETFTTGSSPTGYVLNTLAIKTGGLGSYSGINTPQQYFLCIYSVSGTTATLLSTNTSGNITFNDGDWLQWSGLTNILAPNTYYGYAFGCKTSVGYEAMSVASGHPYAGGRIALFHVGNGSINTNTTSAGTTFNATFDVGVTPPGVPAITSLSLSPANSASEPVYAGTPVALNVQATGAAPLYYTWQTDNGSGGATFTSLSAATTNAAYVLDTTSISPGTYEYQVVVSNSVYAVTSGTVTLNLTSASAPFILTDTSITPSMAYVGNAVTISAAFDGTLPISYQWMFADTNGDPAVAVAGATNATLSLSNLQFDATGSYYLTATNEPAGNAPAASSPASLTVSPEPSPFCMNFAFNNNNYSGEGLYAGPGVIGSGTYWNQITGTQYSQTNVTELADDAATPIYIGMQVSTSNWSVTTAGGNPLLESWMITYNIPQPFSFNNVPQGVYNLVLYGVDGSYANNIQLFTVNGVGLEATNHTYTSFVQGDNYVIFSNLISTGGTLAGTYQSATGGEGDFNGAQLQLISTNISIPQPLITQFSLSGTNLTISGTNNTGYGGTYHLLTSTNLATPVANWTVLTGGTFDSGGSFLSTNAIGANTQQYYIIRVP